MEVEQDFSTGPGEGHGPLQWRLVPDQTRGAGKKSKQKKVTSRKVKHVMKNTG